MDEAVKAQLTADFRAYLDRAAEWEDSDESQSEPNAAAGPDLFTLLAELAALKSEVKLESRQVKSALDQFRDLFDSLREREARLEEERDRRREAERAADKRAQKDLLLELLDLRDRLEAGHEQALRFRPGWLGRRRAKRFVSSMAEGLAMNLRRLEESLTRRGVRPLTVVGRPFDPRTMHAAELAQNPKLPEGHVVAELRKGFLHEDALLRAAEVVVNRPSTTKADTRPHLNN
ncbi:nucleotide exchange factor GrpE [Thiocystis violacea]|uniref:nucleotide exchange factor GrpE n=1 Tax=Thiocystis violacea TaxID=13725 RepID=UPI0019049BB2|nr:nucleotide exchange factor GrpE [Thiocystis violacea]MBK1722194.1 nucleotide exchange factor GrpE [Thiocystis violacea]